MMMTRCPEGETCEGETCQFVCSLMMIVAMENCIDDECVAGCRDDDDCGWGVATRP